MLRAELARMLVILIVEVVNSMIYILECVFLRTLACEIRWSL